MVKKEKIEQGHSKVKELDGGVYENLALLRKSLNKICESQSITKPEELETLNTLFDD